MELLDKDLLDEGTCSDGILAETQDMLNLVSEDGFNVIKTLQAADCSANELVKTTHLKTLTLLNPEVLTSYFQLPYDVQSRINDFITVNLFMEWYKRWVTELRAYWTWVGSIWYRNGLVTISFDPNLVPVDQYHTPECPHIQMWNLGMIAEFDVPPSPQSIVFSQFSKFQQFTFRRIYEAYTKRKDIAPIRLETAQSEPVDGHLNAAHFLIIVDDGNDSIPHRSYWFKDLRGQHITDPTKARAIGFFLISRTIAKLERVGYKLAHYGRTTFAIHPQWAEEIIVPGIPYESVYDYLKNVESGAYLSSKGCDFLADYISERDRVDPDNMYLSESSDDFDFDLTDYMGEEGVYNLLNAMEK